MLRIHQTTSPKAAQRYYENTLSKGDYYTKGQELELAAVWGGVGCDLLHLTGEVDRDAFHALTENLHPSTGEKLTVRNHPRRTVLYDWTFSADKSFSAVHALTGDERLLTAFQESVKETMEEAEREMRTQVWSLGKKENPVTGNMVWAGFTHLTGRPVDDIPDMHLHMHVTVFNVTYSDEKQRWQSGFFRELKRDAPYWEASFRSRLAAKTMALGYGVERTASGKDWRIAGVPDSVRSKFSRRTAEIEARAQALGLTYAEDKAKLGAQTRKSKQEGLSYDELKQTWDSWLTDAEREAIHHTGGDGPAPGGGVSAGDAVDYAIAHSFERKSVVTEKQLITEALRFAFDSPGVTVDAIREEMAARDDLLLRHQYDRTFVTTAEVWEEEKAIVRFAKEGQGRYAPLKRGKHVFAPLVVNGEYRELNEGQKAAVKHVLDSFDCVTAIRGGAGTGKTALMREAAAAIQEGGKEIFTVAPTSDAAKVLHEEGFLNAATIQRLLVDTKMQEQTKDGVIWVDEAGLLSARDMHQLFRIAGSQNARVILSGDTRQHNAVERGDGLRILEKEAGLEVPEVTEIVRQKGAYRDAVALLGKGTSQSISKGFDKLDRLGWIIEDARPDDLHRRLASDYLKATGERRENGEHKTALVVSPTHREGEEVTRHIREGLRQQGRLGVEEREFNQLVNLSWTEAQRRDIRNYQPGLVAQFNQNVEGIRKGERLTITGRDSAGNVTGRDRRGNLKVLPVDLADRFQVYESRSLSLAAGDRLRVSRNGVTSHHDRLHNGTLADVEGFTAQGDIRLRDGRVIDRDYGHIASGYSVTSYSSQGKTVDQVFIAQSAQSFPATFAEQFYVSASRGKERVRIYSDDKKALKQEVQDSAARLSAMELMQENVEERAKRQRVERAERHRERFMRWMASLGDAAERGRELVAQYAEGIVRGMERGQQDWNLGR